MGENRKARGWDSRFINYQYDYYYSDYKNTNNTTSINAINTTRLLLILLLLVNIIFILLYCVYYDISERIELVRLNRRLLHSFDLEDL